MRRALSRLVAGACLAACGEAVHAGGATGPAPPPPPPPTPGSEVAAARAPDRGPTEAPLVAAGPGLGPRSARIDELVAEARADGKIPGCVVVIGRQDRVLFGRAYGDRALEPFRAPMEMSTVFDLASLTKPLATAASIMSLVERQQLDLDAKAARYLPELVRPREPAKAAFTVRQLLTHTAGLAVETPLSSFEHGREAALRAAFEAPLKGAPGERFLYSDLGFFLLDEIVRRTSGSPLDVYAHDHLFEPLGMTETTFLPGDALRARAALTESREGRMMQGEVHDPRAYRLGGVAGHAGLFATARDLTRFAQMILRDGEGEGGRRVFSPATVAAWTAPHDVPGGVRALGWDVRSGFSTSRGDSLSPRAIGHGGYTGTSLWIDPANDLFVLFLSNRVHPSGGGSANPLAAAIANVAVAAVASLEGAPLPSPPYVPCDTASSGASGVDTGIDVLVSEGMARLQGAHVALITNATGRAKDGRRTIDLLQHAPGVSLMALFAPEHGLGTDLDDAVHDARDDASGLPVFSLYGATFAPTEESLRGVDTLVFDVQDAGVRFFTYASTMQKAMAVAAEKRLRFVVLDRPDPIDGLHVEGPLVAKDHLDFANHHPLPVRHGLTLGELARLIDADLHLGTPLDVVPMRGFRREMYFDETGLPWVNPSPNLRSQEEAILYPGVALLEASNVSVGRGTDRPFEQVGAPWVHEAAFERAIAQEDLAGVTFEAASFTPTASTHRGVRCHGVRLTVTDRDTFDPVRTGLALARVLLRLYPASFAVQKVERMVGDARLLAPLRAGAPLAALARVWEADLRSFRAKHDKYVLYPPTPCARE